MSTDPTAIRHSKRGKAHRMGRWPRLSHCGKWMEGKDVQFGVPLSQTDPADRCKTCWPPTKEQL